MYVIDTVEVPTKKLDSTLDQYNAVGEYLSKKLDYDFEDIRIIRSSKPGILTVEIITYFNPNLNDIRYYN